MQAWSSLGWWGRSALVMGMVLWTVHQVNVALAAPAAQAPTVGADAVTTPTPAANAGAPGMATHDAATPATYVVKAGDTLWSVALEVGVDLNTIPCAVAPDFTPDQPLVVGNRLEIPPPHIWCHTVVAGDTLPAVAEHYGVTPLQIYLLPWNQLQRQPLTQVQLQPGHVLRIPLDVQNLDQAQAVAPSASEGVAPDATGASPSFLNWMLGQSLSTSPFTALAVGGPFAEGLQQTKHLERAVSVQPGVVPENWPYGSGNFSWPLSGWLSQGYRYDHRALDIAAPVGTLVTAADRGVVIRAGWNNQGYGLFVVIDHNIDYVTLYAHLSEINVEVGQVVAQGQAIGKVGSTGNSTGPHLHFEIRDFGRLTNPLELLVH
ncbi:MAG: peptidoglycan DD-metalloendopeptidase family protein [Caldilineaceae bacterium]